VRQLAFVAKRGNLFGLLLPDGWCVAGKGGDFTIAFSNGDTVKGQFAYCQFYSDYLSRNLETPADIIGGAACTR
jgi:hypothetical protein